jgi:hypothetical protein
VVTPQDEQFSNFWKRKPELLNAPNESNALDIVSTKQPKSALCAGRAIDEALFFIKADGIHTQPRLFRDLADLHAISHLFSGYNLEFTLESSFFSAEVRPSGD